MAKTTKEPSALEKAAARAKETATAVKQAVEGRDGLKVMLADADEALTQAMTDHETARRELVLLAESDGSDD